MERKEISTEEEGRGIGRFFPRATKKIRIGLDQIFIQVILN